MTIEEKRQAIERHCDNIGDCGACPLYKHINPDVENCYTADVDPTMDAKIERNYAILFGDSEPTGEKTPFTKIDKHIELFPDPEKTERVAADFVESVGSVAQFLDPKSTDTTGTTDAVNHPKHYGREGAMECIDEMVLVFGKEATANFCLLNAWKYRYRAGDKGGDEDLRKSDWYLAKFKELKGGD